MGCLYLLTSPSGKGYLGISSKTAEERWAVHQMRVKEGRDQALQRAIRKYGAKNFKVQTLVVADNWDYLCDLEKKAVKRFNTKAPHGYNLTDGGEGVVGRHITIELRRKLSAAQRKRFGSTPKPQKQFQLRLARQKKPRTQNGSAEHRALVAEKTKAAMSRPDVAAKVKAHALERASNPEWRRKIGESRKGLILPRRTAESKLKMSESMKAVWAKRKAVA